MASATSWTSPVPSRRGDGHPCGRCSAAINATAMTLDVGPAWNVSKTILLVLLLPFSPIQDRLLARHCGTIPELPRWLAGFGALAGDHVCELLSYLCTGSRPAMENTRRCIPPSVFCSPSA